MNDTEQIIGILDSTAENRRLELVLATAGSGEPQLALKLEIFAEGLGWHTQKTIQIDLAQAEQLQFLLGGARHLLKQAQTRNRKANSAIKPVEAKPTDKVQDFSTTRRSA